MRNRIQAQTVQFFMRFSGLTLVGLCAWQGSPSLKWIASTSAALAQGTGAIPPPPDEGAPDDADMTPPPAPSSASGASSSSVITPSASIFDMRELKPFITPFFSNSLIISKFFKYY